MFMRAGFLWQSVGQRAGQAVALKLSKLMGSVGMAF